MNMDNGMRFILAPMSHKALSKMEFSMVQGIIKLSGLLAFVAVSSKGWNYIPW